MRTLLPALLCIPLLASAQTANEYLPAGSMVDPQSCHYDFIDIAASGTPLAMTAAGNPAADDDGAALLPLQAPMPLLGESLDALVVSSNGYVALADSLDREDGGDFSHDCPLPAVPDNGRAESARILLMHADLVPVEGAKVLSEYFDNCPRSSDSATQGACTVIQFDGHRVLDSTPVDGLLRAQAVLYHASGEIVLQYASLDSAASAASAVGLQGRNAAAALAMLCNSSGLPAESALCLYRPTDPPLALQQDPVAITSFSATPASVEPGGAVTLLWQSTNAEGCTLDLATPGVPVALPMDELARGNRVVAPEQTRIYTLSCEGPGGPEVMQLQVEVGDAGGVFADGFEGF